VGPDFVVVLAKGENYRSKLGLERISAKARLDFGFGNPKQGKVEHALEIPNYIGA
jgi:hypothetical protein